MPAVDADQLRALLRPHVAATRKVPHHAIGGVVFRAHNDGIAVGGKRDGGALARLSNGVIAEQLLQRGLGAVVGAFENPRRSNVRVVADSAHHRSVAVRGYRGL